MRNHSHTQEGWRRTLLLLVIVCMGIGLLSRLAYLQIFEYGFYKALAQGQQNLSSYGRGVRGDIFIQDRLGNLHLLATNQKLPYVFASPPEVQDAQDEAQKLADILSIPSEEILPKLQRKESLYEPIKKRITDEEKTRMAELNLRGIYLGEENVRSYPLGSLASHVAGFVNTEGKGQYGVEGYYNDVLGGKEGLLKSSWNPATYFLSNRETVEDGSDIVLTLDYNIQAVAEELLQKVRQELNVEKASIIVMDPADGKLLALANIPSFDPNEYSKVEDLEVFQNSAIQKLFEPGSIFKPITMAGALNEGAVTPSTTYVDYGIVQIGGSKVYNYDQRTWGERSMTEVLEYSINTGVVFAERKLGHAKFLDYVKEFGIFQATNIGLAGEVFSRNTEFQKGYEINFATAAFGQGIEMTPLQIVRAFSAIANSGVPAQPHIVLEEKPKEGALPILSSRTSSQLTAMLTSVVENGYAKTAQIPGYYVAGKTGTAQISWAALGVAKGGYSDQTIQSFIGYAPAFNPRFLILVKLDNPAAKTAEYSAVPIFQDLAKYIIDYYQIPPDYEVE